MTRLPFYDHIKLTLEEEEEAILQGKIKKYRRELHKEYWDEKERGTKGKKDAERVFDKPDIR